MLDALSGPWAIEPAAMAAIEAALRGADVGALQSEFSSRHQALKHNMLDGGIGVVELVGPVTKYASWLQILFGGFSALEAQNAIHAVTASDKVKKILVFVDSPGGQVAGTEELADAVAAARKVKPVTAFIEDLGASAAYRVATEANKVYANAAGLVGSIGTRLTVVDSSRLMDRLGIKVHAVTTGEFKAAGESGTEVTPAHLAYFQSMVDAFGKRFIEAVGRTRRLSATELKKAADGRIHIAADAQKLGLIDGVRSLEQVLAELRRPPAQAPKDATPTFWQIVDNWVAGGMDRNEAIEQVTRIHNRVTSRS